MKKFTANQQTRKQQAIVLTDSWKFPDLVENDSPHHNDRGHKWSVDDHDIMLASWAIASLLFGSFDRTRVVTQ